MLPLTRESRGSTTETLPASAGSFDACLNGRFGSWRLKAGLPEGAHRAHGMADPGVGLP